MRAILDAKESARGEQRAEPVTIGHERISNISDNRSHNNSANQSTATILRNRESDGISYLSIIQKFCCNMGKSFDEMSAYERQDRI